MRIVFATGTPGRPLDEPPALVVVVEFSEGTQGAVLRYVLILIASNNQVARRTRTPDPQAQPVGNPSQLAEAIEEHRRSGPMRGWSRQGTSSQYQYCYLDLVI